MNTNSAKVPLNIINYTVYHTTGRRGLLFRSVSLNHYSSSFRFISTVSITQDLTLEKIANSGLSCAYMF